MHCLDIGAAGQPQRSGIAYLLANEASHVVLPSSTARHSNEIWMVLQTAQLRALNVSDNALGEKGIRACSAALSGQVGFS